MSKPKFCTSTSTNHPTPTLSGCQKWKNTKWKGVQIFFGSFNVSINMWIATFFHFVTSILEWFLRMPEKRILQATLLPFLNIHLQYFQEKKYFYQTMLLALFTRSSSSMILKSIPSSSTKSGITTRKSYGNDQVKLLVGTRHARELNLVPISGSGLNFGTGFGIGINESCDFGTGIRDC